MFTKRKTLKVRITKIPPAVDAALLVAAVTVGLEETNTLLQATTRGKQNWLSQALNMFKENLKYWEKSREIGYEKLIFIERRKPRYFKCGKIRHVNAECNPIREETEGERKRNH